MGDLILTCSGDLSPRRRVGMALGRGRPLSDIVAGMGGEVASGVRTTAGACALADLHGVEMPVAHCTQRVLDGELEPKDAIELLLSRQLCNENE